MKPLPHQRFAGKAEPLTSGDSAASERRDPHAAAPLTRAGHIKRAGGTASFGGAGTRSGGEGGGEGAEEGGQGEAVKWLQVFNPEAYPKILNPKPSTQNPKPETLNPRPETRNPNSETRNPKSETRNPISETRNPKP